MSTRAALLDAVRAAPDDLAPRLVFADFLDEHGDPDRAEFVRVQCDPGRPGHHERAKELLAANWRRWFGPLLTPAGGLLTEYDLAPRPQGNWADHTTLGVRTAQFVYDLTVRRGFATRAHLNPLVRRPGCSLSQLLDAEPVIDLWVTVDRPGRWERLSEPALARIRSLQIDPVRARTDASRLAATAAFDDPHLTGVRELLLLGMPAGSAAVVRRLAGSPLAARLTAVTLFCDADAVRELASAPESVPWERFKVYGPRWRQQRPFAAAFAALPFRGTVRDLVLPSVSVGPAILRAMARGGWGRLERLNATRCNVGPACVRALAAGPLVDRLRALSLRENPGVGSDPAAVRALADALDPTRLESLDLRACELGADVIAAVRARFGDRVRCDDAP